MTRLHEHEDDLALPTRSGLPRVSESGSEDGSVSNAESPSPSKQKSKKGKETKRPQPNFAWRDNNVEQRGTATNKYVGTSRSTGTKITFKKLYNHHGPTYHGEKDYPPGFPSETDRQEWIATEPRGSVFILDSEVSMTDAIQASSVGTSSSGSAKGKKGKGSKAAKTSTDCGKPQ